MRAYEIAAFGFDNLAMVEREQPRAQGLGAGEVLIRVRAVSLNFRDLMMVQGHYDPRLTMGRVPCSDGAGEVVAVGAAVTAFVPGDVVMGSFFQHWFDGPMTSSKSRGALGGDVDGMLREFAVLSEDGVVKAPAGWTSREAATLPCAAVTAFNALHGGVPGAGPAGAAISPGDTVLVQGTGGVSIFALQLAKAAGARVIVTSSSDEKLAKAKALGADGLVNYKAVPDWEKPVRAMSDGGVDLVVEVGGSGTLGKSIKAVRTGGTIAMIGVLTGVKGEVDTVSLLMRSITVRGINVGSVAMLRQLVRACEVAGHRPVIDKVFGFEEARAAMEYMKSGAHFGKVVVEVGGGPNG